MTDMTTTTTKDRHHCHSLPGTFCHHANHFSCSYQQRQQQQQHQHQQQQQPLSIFLPTVTTDTIPATWIDSNVHYCHCQTTAVAAAAAAAAVNHHQEDMNHLRETIASLRDQAKQLEMTDLMVKKSIQVVAKKRRLAQHYSQWDWCDPLDDDDNDDDDDDNDNDNDDDYDDLDQDMDLSRVDRVSGGSNSSSIPVLDDDASETDDDQQDCGGNWEWVN